MRRILTALFLIPPLLFILLVAPAWAFLLLAEVVALVVFYEIAGLARRLGYRIHWVIAFPATAVLTASFYRGQGALEWCVLLLVPLVALSAVRRGAPGSKTLGEVGVTLLGVLYAGLLTGALVGLRATGPDGVGRAWVFFVLAVIMLGDTGAYYTGLALGRRKLAPRISPNKTVEGLFGGLAASVAAAVLMGGFLPADLDAFRAGALGLVLAALGVMGDLFESLLKRSAGVKDTSSLFPGHGGLMDRVDSLLFASPALLAYVRLLH